MTLTMGLVGFGHSLVLAHRLGHGPGMAFMAFMALAMALIMTMAIARTLTLAMALTWAMPCSLKRSAAKRSNERRLFLYWAWKSRGTMSPLMNQCPICGHASPQPDA